MKLGELIDTLKALPPTHDVKFDNGRVPTDICSWRGSYDELTIDSEPGADRMSVKALLSLAKSADGDTFTGYKGGEYVMNRDTPVWADPYGECHCYGIVGSRVVDGTVILATANLEEYTA